MNKKFAIGFFIGLLIFSGVNLLAAHLSSDCGLLAVFGRDACADDIVRLGWPLVFYRDGGFAYNHIFNSIYFLINTGTGLAFAALVGGVFLRCKKTLSK